MYWPVARFSKKKSLSSGQRSASKFTVVVAHPLVVVGVVGAITGAGTGGGTGAGTGTEPQKEGLEVESLHPSRLIQSVAAETRA